jgi:hypothetical protein
MVSFKSVLAGALVLGVLGAIPAAPAAAEEVIKPVVEPVIEPVIKPVVKRVVRHVVRHVGVKKGAWVCGYRNRFGEVVVDYRCFWRPYSFYYDGPVHVGHFDDLGNGDHTGYYLSRHYRWRKIW